MKFFIQDDSGVTTELVPVSGGALPGGASGGGDGPPLFNDGPRSFVPVGDYGLPVVNTDEWVSKTYETQGAKNGPVQLVIRVAPTDTGIVYVSTGPARGHNFSPVTADIKGTPLPSARGASHSANLTVGFNGTPGSDLNLNAGDHILTGALATASGTEFAVMFNRQ